MGLGYVEGITDDTRFDPGEAPSPLLANLWDVTPGKRSEISVSLALYLSGFGMVFILLPRTCKWWCYLCAISAV